MGVAARVRLGGGLVLLVLLAAAAADAQPWFADIAPRSQFSDIADNNFTGRQYFPQPMCGGVAICDSNNDGWKDLCSSNGDIDYLAANAAQHDTMFHNVEGKYFVDVSEAMGPDLLRVGFQHGSAFGDLNHDGWPDLVVPSWNARPRILLNTARGGRHWLLIEVRGRLSNRDGIGTKMKVTTASGRGLHAHVTPSVGFMYSSDKRVRFGLSAEPTAASIEIRWPSGKVSTLQGVKADQVLRVEEPEA